MSIARESTVSILVEHGVVYSIAPKELKTLVNKVCAANDWDEINDKEVFDVCKKLSFEYLLMSFNSQHKKAANEELAKRLDSYTKRFPEFA